MNKIPCRLARLFCCALMFGCPSLVPPGLGGTGWALPATEPTKTSVQDTLFRADGALANGTLVISWGQSQLARDAQNYFGIKAHAHHARVAYPTFERVNGRNIRISAEFARYESIEECFADRDRLIATAACYAEARACRDNPEAFTRALAAHWATDPQYADKLLRVYRENALDALDTIPD